MREQYVRENTVNNILNLNQSCTRQGVEPTFLFLPSLSLQSDIPLPGLGEGVERTEKGDGMRSLIGGAGEGVGVGELSGDGHPEKTMGV